MANVKGKDADGAAVYLKATGAGTNGDPAIPEHLESNSAATLTYLGALTETAPASDTASSGTNGRLQRIAQRVTSFIALLPTSLGQKAKTTSLAVTLASDDDSLALLGALTETAPASDTASSGQNGRLQRIAQRITSLIALIPVALGQGTMAQSFRVVVASDQATYPVTASVALPTVIYNGQTNVTTAGTRVVLAASQAILSGVTIKAKAANSGAIYVGSSAVSSSNGYVLAAGDTIFFEIANLNTVNIDSAVNGEGVSYVAS